MSFLADELVASARMPLVLPSARLPFESTRIKGVVELVVRSVVVDWTQAVTINKNVHSSFGRVPDEVHQRAIAARHVASHRDFSKLSCSELKCLQREGRKTQAAKVGLEDSASCKAAALRRCPCGPLTLLAGKANGACPVAGACFHGEHPGSPLSDWEGDSLLTMRTQENKFLNDLLQADKMLIIKASSRNLCRR